MEQQFADWLRLAHLEPDHDTVQRRWAGIESFGSDLNNETAINLAQLFHQLPVASEFKSKFQTSFHEADNSFPMSDNDVELAVLAGTVLVHAFTTDHPVTTVGAFSLICPDLVGRRSCVVPEIVSRARDVIEKSSASLRDQSQRRIKANVVSQHKDTLEAIGEACKASPPAELATHLNTLVNSILATLRVAAANDKMLQSNFDTYREESDVLWWLIGGCSRDLGVRLEDIDWPAAALHIGKELAQCVRVLPGPVAFREILLRAITASGHDVDSEVALNSAVSKLDKEFRRTWSEAVSPNPAFGVCPLLNAVNWSGSSQKQSDWSPRFKERFSITSGVKMSPVDLAAQAYTETLLIRSVPRAESKKE